VILHDGTVIPCGLIVWSTGIGPQPIMRSLSKEYFEISERGQIVTDEFLRVKKLNNVYAMGDCAQIENNPLASLAQVAQQEGIYLAKVFNRRSEGKEATEPFKFNWMGRLAYIGHYDALMETSSGKIHGFASWFIWRSAYLTRIGSIKNKLQVPVNWLRTLLWGRDVTNF